MNLVISFRSNKFKHGLRPVQDKLIRAVIDSNKKMVIVNAPTGVGKSLTGMMSGYYKNKNLSNPCKNNQTLYICTSKMLPDQLHHDFPEANLS